MSSNTEKKSGINKILWGSISAVIIVAVIGFFIYQGLNSDNKADKNTSSNISSEVSEIAEVSFQMTVTVEGEKVLFDKELKAEEGETLLEVMKDSFAAGNYSLVESDGMITELCGEAQDAAANKYWMYTVNGEYASVGAAEYLPKEGDKVVFDLQVVQF